MTIDAWLPVGFVCPGAQVIARALYAGQSWQLYQCTSEERVMVARVDLAKRWVESALITDHQAEFFKVGGEAFCALPGGASHALTPVAGVSAPSTASEAVAFADAFRSTRAIDPTTPLHDSVYVEKLSRLLPTFSLTPAVADDIVIGTWLTGGVAVPATAERRIRKLTGWIGKSTLTDILSRAGLQGDTEGGSRPDQTDEAAGAHSPSPSAQTPQTKAFTLAGRPELQQFLHEHVVDIVENPERYAAMGISFASAVILHGPPGCGKTFAVERLVDYLGWPSYTIDAASVASPYIHDTSKKVAEVFNLAMQNSPSVVVIDEMEAFLADRQSGAGSSSHRVEEVAEFLRLIPAAIKKRVLILAMTNRLEMIDPAILRRGRFDHVVAVEMPTETEVRALLGKLLSALPCHPECDIDLLSKELAGRPLSDADFVVREAGRLAARAGERMLRDEDLLAALQASPSRVAQPDVSRKIGFT